MPDIDNLENLDASASENENINNLDTDTRIHRFVLKDGANYTPVDLYLNSNDIYVKNSGEPDAVAQFELLTDVLTTINNEIEELQSSHNSRHTTYQYMQEMLNRHSNTLKDQEEVMSKLNALVDYFCAKPQTDVDGNFVYDDQGNLIYDTSKLDKHLADKIAEKLYDYQVALNKYTINLENIQLLYNEWTEYRDDLRKQRNALAEYVAQMRTIISAILSNGNMLTVQGKPGPWLLFADPSYQELLPLITNKVSQEQRAEVYSSMIEATNEGNGHALGINKTVLEETLASDIVSSSSTPINNSLRTFIQSNPGRVALADTIDIDMNGEATFQNTSGLAATEDGKLKVNITVNGEHGSIEYNPQDKAQLLNFNVNLRDVLANTTIISQDDAAVAGQGRYGVISLDMINEQLANNATIRNTIERLSIQTSNEGGLTLVKDKGLSINLAENGGLVINQNNQLAAKITYNDVTYENGNIQNYFKSGDKIYLGSFYNTGVLLGNRTQVVFTIPLGKPVKGWTNGTQDVTNLIRFVPSNWLKQQDDCTMMYMRFNSKQVNNGSYGTYAYRGDTMKVGSTHNYLVCHRNYYLSGKVKSIHEHGNAIFYASAVKKTKPGVFDMYIRDSKGEKLVGLVLNNQKQNESGTGTEWYRIGKITSCQFNRDRNDITVVVTFDYQVLGNAEFDGNNVTRLDLTASGTPASVTLRGTEI